MWGHNFNAETQRRRDAETSAENSPLHAPRQGIEPLSLCLSMPSPRLSLQC